MHGQHSNVEAFLQGQPVLVVCLQVCNLNIGSCYQFRVFAANLVGVGKASEASEAFLCETWTMPEPGKA